jgi:hypothetical protein
MPVSAPVMRTHFLSELCAVMTLSFGQSRVRTSSTCPLGSLK